MKLHRSLVAVLALGIGGWSLIGGCGGGATCDDACSHYLSCAGADSSYQAQCVSTCDGMGATADWLSNYVTTDCATAVEIVDGNGGSVGGTDSSSSSGSSGGCYPDGHSCSAGSDCCNGNCIDQSVGDWICY